MHMKLDHIHREGAGGDRRRPAPRRPDAEPVLDAEHILAALLETRRACPRRHCVALGADRAASRVELAASSSRRAQIAGGSMRLDPRAQQLVRPCRGRGQAARRRVRLDRAPAARRGRGRRRRAAHPRAGRRQPARHILAALQKVRGGQRVTRQNPESTYQALEKYGRDLTAMRARASSTRSSAATRRSAASSRCCRGGPRTTRCSSASRASARRPSSRGWPSASSAATCPRGSRTSASSRSTWARSSPAPSTAASSRSASRPCSRRSRTPRARSSCSSTSCTRSSAPARPRARWTRPTCSSRCSRAASCTCIGATTLDEYRKHIEKDAALERRFQPVFVDEPTRRGHDLDPARPAGALRGPPRRAHHRLGAGRRGGAVAPLHHRPLPARQGDRPRRRGRQPAAHGDRLDARRARRARAPAHPARDRARGAAQGEATTRPKARLDDAREELADIERARQRAQERSGKQEKARDRRAARDQVASSRQLQVEIEQAERAD